MTDALHQLDRESLDPHVTAALRRCLRERAANVPPPLREQPAGLSEREVEVLRLAAGVLTRRVRIP